jgi:putative ABC transport system permease protein
MPVPLAWKNLTHNRRRLIVAVGGIAFAVVLMFMQQGFENALFDSTVQVLVELDADLLLTSRSQYSLTSGEKFLRRRIHQARRGEGVRSVDPLYIESFSADYKPAGGKRHPIRVLAFELDAHVFRSEEIRSQLAKLRRPDTAIIDRMSKPVFRASRDERELLQQPPGELSGKTIRLAGSFALGTDFANDGNLITSATNFARYFPWRGTTDDPLGTVDLGIVRLDDPTTAEDVRAKLQEALPSDVAVWTKEGLIEREVDFWRASTPIGYIFAVGTIMGFVVGIVICYQTIYTDISNHMPEFATLKAMGYRTGYFFAVVLRQSLYLAVLGFVPGLTVSFVSYQTLAAATGLLLDLNLVRASSVLLLTMAMCLASGMLAIRKLLAADPAELF